VRFHFTGSFFPYLVILFPANQIIFFLRRVQHPGIFINKFFPGISGHFANAGIHLSHYSVCNNAHTGGGHIINAVHFLFALPQRFLCHFALGYILANCHSPYGFALLVSNKCQVNANPNNCAIFFYVSFFISILNFSTGCFAEYFPVFFPVLGVGKFKKGHFKKFVNAITRNGLVVSINQDYFAIWWINLCNTQRSNLKNGSKSGLAFTQCFFCLLAFGYVEAMSYISDKLTLAVEIWGTYIQNYFVFTTCMEQAIFHLKRLAFIKCSNIGFKASVKIIGMHSFSPAISYFLFYCSSCEFKPWIVKIITKFIEAWGPD